MENLIFIDIHKMDYFNLESWDNIKKLGGLKSILLELNRDYKSVYNYDCISHLKIYNPIINKMDTHYTEEIVNKISNIIKTL